MDDDVRNLLDELKDAAEKAQQALMKHEYAEVERRLRGIRCSIAQVINEDNHEHDYDLLRPILPQLRDDSIKSKLADIFPPF